jgi:5-hydroxyisourate hydrolase-like protein (transthyretin family)
MKIQNSKLILHFTLSFCILIFAFCIFVPKVNAQKASLYFSPSSGTYTVGNTFLVQVKVNSGGVAINAADGTIIFDPDKLEVAKISKEESAFTLWVQEPIFSNSLGTVNFAGGKPSPGFIGAAGIIINIFFRAKTSGTTNLTFASGSVLADDGKGTNILGSLGSGVYNLTAKEIETVPPEEITPQPTAGPPKAPIVSSPDCPDENRWCSNNSPRLEWKLSPDVNKISYAIDQNPKTNPREIFNATSSASFSDLEDGIWYFHINFKNQYGWGALAHRKLMIDTKPPLPFEIEVKMEDQTDPQPVLLFDTTDELSGIEYYELTIGKGESFQVKGMTEENPLKLPPQAPGKHLVVVRAFDKAGNFTDAKKEIEVLPIETPEIKSCPKSIYPNQSLRIEGKGLADIKIKVFLQKEGQEPVLKRIDTDSQGNFVFVSDELKEGNYKIWFQAQDKRGALSLETKACQFYVGLPTILRFGKIAIDYLTMVITLIVLIIGLLLIIFYVWYRISIWRKKMRAETKEVAQVVLAAFKDLRKEVEEQIEYLDGKPGLTQGERKVRDKLKEALDVSEQFIEKELKDIEKELE